MLVLKVLGCIVVLVGIFFAISAFNEHCEKKFGHRFFTKIAFIFLVCTVLTATIGYEWYQDSVATNGDVLNGIVLMFIAGGFTAGLVYFNISCTNLTYGVGGSAVQIVVLGGLAHVSLFFIILWIGIGILSFFGAQPVRIVD